MLRQLQLADDLRAEQADDVREDREPEAREQLLRDGRAAEDVALLQDERLHPGAGQVGRADQAVVAATDDDRVVRLGQGACLRDYPDCIGSMQVYPTEMARRGPDGSPARRDHPACIGVLHTWDTKAGGSST